MQYFGRKSARKKMFFSFLIIMIIPIFIFLTLILLYFIKDEKEKNAQIMSDISVTASAKFDKEIGRINEYVTGLSVTNIVEKIMYSQGPLLDYERFDPVEIRNYNQQLYVSSVLNPFTKNMDVIFNEKDIVFFNSDKLSSLNTYLHATFDLTDSQYTKMREKINKYNKGTIIYPVKQTNPGGESLVYIKTIPGKGDKLIRGTLICIIDTQHIKDYTDEILREDTDMLIVYDDGLVLGDADIWYGLNKYIQENGSLEDNVLYNVKIDIIKYTVVKNTNALGVESYVLVDSISRLDKTGYVVAGTLLLLIVLMIFAYFFAEIITKRNYQPIKKLVDMIDNPDEFDKPADGMAYEYSSIYNSYKNIFIENKMQQHQIALHQSSLLEYCWKVLLEQNHEIDEGVTDKIEELIPVHLFSRCFCCVLMEGDHKSIAEKMSNSLNEKDYSVCSVVNYSDYSSLVVNVKDENAIGDVICVMGAVMDKYADKQTICSVGLSYQDIKEINKSYNEAILIANFEHPSGRKKMIFRKDYNEFMSNFYYTIPQETQLGNMLRNGDYDGAINLVTEMLGVNMSIHNISPSAIRNFFFAVYLTGIRVAMEMDYKVKKHRMPDELLNLHNIEDISTVVYSYFSDICDSVKKESKNNHKFTDDIIGFINENISNPNLSMQMVSEHIGRSISFTSRLFNKIYNMPFIQHVNRKRITMACEMLKTKKMEISRISEAVGFSSEITFRRSFHRFKGLTPSKYRDMV